MTTDASKASRPTQRVRVFVDYWNLQLALNTRESNATGQRDSRFPIDWQVFPAWVAAQAASVASPSNYSYEGTLSYVSYNPVGDISFRHWITTWLNRQPGIQVVAKERRPKMPPRCTGCHMLIEYCPHCKAKVSATTEKGIDTALATDMIRLAWEDAYDIGVIASSDSDFVPVVEFLDSRGRKMIQAGFPPAGAHLATSCWASLDLFPRREEYRRR